MSEEHVIDYLPAYALGSLDEEDLLRVARHLPHCPACRSELAGYWDTMDAISFSLPPQVPPADLRARILQRVAPAQAAQPVPVQARAAENMSEREPGGFSRWLAGIFSGRASRLAWGALALLVVLFLAGSNIFLWRQVNNLQARAMRDNTRVVRMDGTQNAPKAYGYVMVFRGENYGTLVVEDAPPLQQGKQYQLWMIHDGKRTSGGVFSVNDQGYGVLNIVSAQPLESFTTFGITVEPSGGSPGPTGAKVLGGGL